MSRAAVTARRIGRLNRTVAVTRMDGDEITVVRVPRRPARPVATRLAVEASLCGVA